MSLLAIYDTMIFFQWAVLPPDRRHGTEHALADGLVRLCMSREHLAEIQDVLSRPELMQKFPAATPERIGSILEFALKHADMFETVPAVFTWQRHPDDDHLFNLAIAAQARLLVTWEKRILGLATEHSVDADHLRSLAPNLSIISPADLRQHLRVP